MVGSSQPAGRGGHIRTHAGVVVQGHQLGPVGRLRGGGTKAVGPGTHAALFSHLNNNNNNKLNLAILPPPSLSLPDAAATAVLFLVKALGVSLERSSEKIEARRANLRRNLQTLCRGRNAFCNSGERERESRILTPFLHLERTI